MDWFQKSKRIKPEDEKLYELRPRSTIQQLAKPKSPDDTFDVLMHELQSSFDKNESETIELLEKHNNDPNFDINGTIEGYSLMHRACEMGRPNLLAYLVKNKADINQKTRSGDTPLMCAIKKCNSCDSLELSRRSLRQNEDPDNYGSMVCYSHMRCARILVYQPNINLDAKNNNELTALSFASSIHDELKRDKYIKLLLRTDDSKSLCIDLYKALVGKLDSQFVMELNLLAKEIGEPKILQLMYKKYTLLQSVCKFGMLESTKRLIQMGADLHLAPIKKERPVQMACKFAQPHILQYLIQKNAHIISKDSPMVNDKDRNLLHITARSHSDKSQSHECLKILLEKPSTCIGGINDQDYLGKTPLHYSAAYDNELSVVELLEKGAEIDLPDKWNRTPLMHISPEAFKKYLNNMIVGGEGHQNKTQTDLTFNFEKLFKKEDEQYSFPTDFLREIKKIKKLRKLLKHPIFSLIIYFKWQNVRTMFYLYFILYIAFCITYTILIIVEVDLRINSEGKNETQPYTHPNFCTNESPASIILNIMLSIFALLELSKMIGGIMNYFIDFENILRITVITLSFFVIQCFTGSIFHGYCNHIQAISLLLTWFEFFLVAGKHPKLSFHVSTFRSASLGLLKFLTIHFFLLLGFALSFHTLFRSNEKDNIFTNPIYAIFKTTVMLTSEFESGEIPFHGYPGISHIIFLAYIFTATIVLFNLMIGLAFAKVNEMEKNPSLYESLACIDIITHFESHFLSRYNNIFQSSNRCRKITENQSGIETGESSTNKSLSPKVLVSKDNYLQTILKFDAAGKITILKVESSKKKFFSKNKKAGPKIHDKIAENARKIVSKKITGNEEPKRDIKNLNIKLDAIANELVAVKNFKSDAITTELINLRNSIDELKDLLISQKK